MFIGFRPLRKALASQKLALDAMDHEKPEAVFPQIVEYRNQQEYGAQHGYDDPQNNLVNDWRFQHGVSPDIEFEPGEPGEPAPIEEPKERRGESLW